MSRGKKGMTKKLNLYYVMNIIQEIKNKIKKSCEKSKPQEEG